jgi:hypothetical protein
VHPRFYAAQVREPALADDVDAALTHFLDRGIRESARVSALFNEQCYRERLAAHGGAVPDGAHPFLHWLTVGWQERIVPTVLFDEAYYLTRHHDLRRGPEWAFAQYLRAGCYASARWPSPFGPNYGGPPAPDARARQDPPLVTGMLHRSDRYDLRRTSWLEEGVVAGHTKLAALGSPRMQALVAKAAEIEPLVLQPRRERWVSWPPHSHPMAVPTARIEQVRRAVGLSRADSVFLVAGTDSPTGPAAELVARTVQEHEPGAPVLVITTEGDGHPRDLLPGAAVVDVSAPLDGLTDRHRLLGLLDVVRGVRPRRVVVAGSDLGWQMLRTYGPTLRHEMSLGACLPPEEHDEDGIRGGAAVRGFQSCFDVLDWVVADTGVVRDRLVGRYLLGAAAQARLLSAEDPGERARVVLTAGGEQ